MDTPVITPHVNIHVNNAGSGFPKECTKIVKAIGVMPGERGERYMYRWRVCGAEGERGERGTCIGRGCDAGREGREVHV